MAGDGRVIDGMWFDGVADEYQRIRPGYPAALFADLLALTGGPGAALEVGCGTGQASADLIAGLVGARR